MRWSYAILFHKKAAGSDTPGTRVFSLRDQEWFAVLSGGRNPMHMDPVYARRTAAGAPAVHGIHLLLWSLDRLAWQDGIALPAPPFEAATTFETFVLVGERVEATLEMSETDRFVVAVSVNGQVRFRATVRPGGPARPAPAIPEAMDQAALLGTPATPEITEMKGLAGRIPFVAQPGMIEREWPALAGWIGWRPVAALAATSYLVGMVVPGLHSIYIRLAVQIGGQQIGEQAGGEGLRYHVTSAKPLLRSIGANVAGGGVSGTVTALVRREPVEQPSFDSLKAAVAPGAFAGQAALVVGGSRGLGEFTAKLLAAGGADVVITYARGAAEAERVRDEINAGGGTCGAAELDVLQGGDAQPPPGAFTHAYYFATPSIISKSEDVFSPEQFRTFIRFYVEEFARLAQALRRSNPAVSLFYPSTVYVEDRPRGMTEYAMAKLAGEALCADINRFMAPMTVTVVCLPRLRTDQTAALIDTRTDETLATMLPVIHEVQARSAAVMG